MRSDTFVFDGHEYTYFPFHPHNNPPSNERRVQLAVAMPFVEKYAGSVVEIGNVTSYYRTAYHPIYDATETNDECPSILLDVRELEFKPDNCVLSISVMQCIGMDAYQVPIRDGPDGAAKLINRILRDSAHCFLTWPNGYHPTLDAAVKAGTFSPYLKSMQRDENNDWVQMETPTLTEYNSPYISGNSICMVVK